MIRGSYEEEGRRGEEGRFPPTRYIIGDKLCKKKRGQSERMQQLFIIQNIRNYSNSKGSRILYRNNHKSLIIRTFEIVPFGERKLNAINNQSTQSFRIWPMIYVNIPQIWRKIKEWIGDNNDDDRL